MKTCDEGGASENGAELQTERRQITMPVKLWKKADRIAKEEDYRGSSDLLAQLVRERWAEFRAEQKAFNERPSQTTRDAVNAADVASGEPTAGLSDEAAGTRRKASKRERSSEEQ